MKMASTGRLSLRRPSPCQYRSSVWVCVVIILLTALVVPIIASSGISPVYAQHGPRHHSKSNDDDNSNGQSDDNGNGQSNNNGNGQQQAAVVSCTLTLPQNPLTPLGLATPFILSTPGQANGQGNGNNNNNNNQGNGNNNNNNQGTCTEANAASAAFAQAVVFDPTNNTLGVYNPVVVDAAHSTPALQPPVPQFSANAVVALWFGFNGNNLTLAGPGAGTADCVNGLPGSIFGQVSYCNAAMFFQAVNAAIAAKQITVPLLGMAQDGQSCPTVRDFSLVDQDQSDNVPVKYLVTAQGTIAQNTPANLAQLQGATMLANGSDEGLASNALFPAIGCATWSTTDLAAQAQGQTTTVPSLALNEIQAATDQPQVGPVALVPISDPMTVVTDNNGNVNIQASITKTDAYRVGVDQPPIDMNNIAAAESGPYCQALLQTGLKRIASQQFQNLTQTITSPDPMKATNLYLFMVQRFQTSFGNDGGLTPSCLNTLGMQQNPVTVEKNGNGVVTAATITLPGQATPNGITGTPACPQGTTSVNQSQGNTPGVQQASQTCVTPTPTTSQIGSDQG